MDAMLGRVRLVHRQSARCQGVIAEDRRLQSLPALRGVSSRWVRPRRGRLSATHCARQGVMRAWRCSNTLSRAAAGMDP